MSRPSFSSGAARLLLQGMIGSKAVADIGLAALEHGMRRDEILVHPPGLDDVVGDRIEEKEVGVRREDDADIGEVDRTVLEGREHRDTHVRRGKPAVGHPRPQDRMHLRHVGAHNTKASVASMSS